MCMLVVLRKYDTAIAFVCGALIVAFIGAFAYLKRDLYLPSARTSDAEQLRSDEITLDEPARQPEARCSSRLRDARGLHDDGGERGRARDLDVLPGLALFDERVPGHHSLVLLHGERHQGTLHDRHGPAAPRAPAPHRTVGPRGARVRMGGATTGRPHPAARLRAPRHRDDDRGDGATALLDQVATASSRPVTVDVSVSERTRTTRLMPTLFNR